MGVSGELEGMGVGFAILKWVRKAHRKVIFKQKLDKGERMSHLHVGEEHSRQRGLMWEHAHSV